MRTSYDKAFEIVVGLEGHISNDPRDPGGFTVYGLSSRYNIGITKDLTLDDAKAIYLNNYWLPAGCDTAPFPWDIVLFDSAVNPQSGGNAELLNQKPENWQDFLILRMCRYMRKSKDIYVKGHLFRVLNLYQRIREISLASEPT